MQEDGRELESNVGLPWRIPRSEGKAKVWPFERPI